MFGAGQLSSSQRFFTDLSTAVLMTFYRAGIIVRKNVLQHS